MSTKRAVSIGVASALAVGGLALATPAMAANSYTFGGTVMGGTTPLAGLPIGLLDATKLKANPADPAGALIKVVTTNASGVWTASTATIPALVDGTAVLAVANSAAFGYETGSCGAYVLNGGAVLDAAKLATDPAHAAIANPTALSCSLTSRVATAPVIANATPKVGDTLSASDPTWTAVSATNPFWATADHGPYTYQWSANGTAIAGATKATYSVAPAQGGKTITVAVKGVDLGAAAPGFAAVSAPTAKVTAVASTLKITKVAVSAGKAIVTVTLKYGKVGTTGKTVVTIGKKKATVVWRKKKIGTGTASFKGLTAGKSTVKAKFAATKGLKASSASKKVTLK